MQYSIVFATVASASFALAQAAGGLQINTPSSLTVCQPALLSWTGGSAPYFVTVIPGGQPSAAPLETFAQQTGNQLTWNVNVASGTSVTVALKDSTGAQAFTAAVNILASPNNDNSCISSSPGGAAGGSGTTVAVTTSGSTTAAVTTSGAAGAGTTMTTSVKTGVSTSTAPAGAATTSSKPATGATSPSGSSGSAAPSASPSKSTSGASKVGAGIATVAVAALVALFA